MSAQVWDAQARTMRDAMWAAWAEPNDAVAEHIEAFDIVFDSGDIVVELGCGPGRLLRPLALKHPDVFFIGLDISSEMLKWAGSNCLGLTNVDLRLCLEKEALPVESHSVATLYSMLVFQHLDDLTKLQYLCDIYGLLNAKGEAVIQFVTHADRGPLSHPTTIEEFSSLCQIAGLSVCRTVDGLGHPDWAWAWVRA